MNSTSPVIKPRIIFMGTPIFAAEILNHLLLNKYNIIGVISQPDKKVGRKKIVTFSKVKEVALEHNLPVFQPLKIREDYSFIADLNPDLIITAAYGQIIPKAVLDIPKLGCINVHGSLLPKYRGGAPIHYAVINGETKTGVTIMEMSPKMDAGNIISQQSFPIAFTDTLGDVHDNMIDIAKELLVKTLPAIIKQTYNSCVQEQELVTFSPNISPAQEQVNWNDSGINIYNLIRGLNPWPIAYTTLEGKRLKLIDVHYIAPFEQSFLVQENLHPGTILAITKDGIAISTKDGNILVKSFQLEGKKRTTISEYINGNGPIKVGMVLL